MKRKSNSDKEVIPKKKVKKSGKLLKKKNSNPNFKSKQKKKKTPLNKGKNNKASSTKAKNDKPSSIKENNDKPSLNKENNDTASKFEKPTIKNRVFNKSKNSKFSKGKPNMDKKRFNSKKDSNIIQSKPQDEKPNWLEYKKEQRELREKRRAKRLEDVYEVAIQAKKIGEDLRRVNLPPKTQEKLTKKLHDLIKDQYAKMIFAHDLSRVIQWQIKYCSPDIRIEIVEELRPHLQEMFHSKYAKNVIKTLLKSGSENVKKIVLQTCPGHVVKLLTGTIAAPLFEKIYVEVASSTEKFAFKQEFYGDIYKNSKDPNIKTLTDVYKNSKGMKTATLSAVKTNLIKILNKNLINSTLVHTVLYEYLSNCSKDDKTEILALVRPLIAELSQTKDGAKAANLCIWNGTNKDRKLIMKTLKEHIKDITTSEHGHLMILALLDCVDDTVLLKKILLQEILNNLNEIVSNEYGRRVILYIVARRDTCYFHPAFIDYLKEGDNNPSSKKPADIREQELLESVIDNLLANIVTDVKIWLSNGPLQLVTLAILKASHGSRPVPAFTAISKFITNPNSVVVKDEQTFKAIEEPGLHMVLKKLIQTDQNRIKENEETFGEILFKHLSSEVLECWIDCNRSCFLLVTLIQNECGNIVSELKTKLRKIENLKSKKTKGATILLQKLDSDE